MLSWIREKFGTAVIGGIIAFIAFVFVFYGVFSPKATRGLHEGAVAGTVNGDAISISEFNRALNQRIEFFKNYAGGKITEEQLKQFGIRDSVFQDLVNRKIMLQEANRIGLSASDEEVKAKVQEIPAFQKEGKFDYLTYKQVLEANGQSPGSFEKMVREEVSVQRWDGYFRERARFSEEEIRKEFNLTRDKREIKYVLLTSEGAKKNITVEAADVQKYLADAGKLSLVKLKYEEGKATLYKGQTLDQAKDAIARGLMAGDKLEEIQKLNQKLADQIIPLLNSDKSPKNGNDIKINALLKAYDAQVKLTGPITRERTFLPAIGEAKELVQDAFDAKAPIDIQANGKAKKYQLADRILVAAVIDSQKPDLSQYASVREGLVRQVVGKKVRDQSQDWIKKLTAQAKIDKNTTVLQIAE